MHDAQTTSVPINKILLNTHTPGENNFEFTVDCGAVYFGAVYDKVGHLQHIDQYFYTEATSRWDLASAISHGDEIIVDDQDFPAETYLVTKEGEDGEEWLRFHAIVPDIIDTNYFAQKYLNETH
jgi:hypothetical protein